MSDEFINKATNTINTYTNIKYLKKAIIKNEYSSQNINFTRLLVWKSIILLESLNIQHWDDKLFKSRAIYEIYYKEFKVPFHELGSDHLYYQKGPIQTNIPTKNHKVEVNGSYKIESSKVQINTDPLSNSTSQFSTAYGEERDLDILRIIIMDIERLFPGEKLFMKDLTHKRNLIEILFIWNKLNSTVGYKQGMHEILGLIYMKIHEESIDLTKTKLESNEAITKSIINLYDAKYLTNDIFIIFNHFMINLSINYYQESNLIEQIDKFNKNLIKIDQNLHYNLINKLKIESQFWLIRYYRLLLIRELGIDTSIKLWDKLISIENWEVKIIELLPYIITMLLINIKKELIISDFGEGLYLLLHYPINNSNGNIFIDKVFQNSFKLMNCETDQELYKLGLKLNQKYNPDLGEKKGLEFDKMRLEMRLKMKVSKMMK